ncbi:serine hydrolase domain-containing protein [Novosphingobium bradum]|uniref:Serine hydrolase domain-containing protein n=1 Tax=Novosphingobium bradum TaxID=1737444 RepID=A0ABV7IJC5_9SPHN
MAADLSLFAATLDQAIGAGHLAGAAALVWQGGEIVHESTAGLANIAAGLPMTGTTIMRIASMTKPLTSLAALLLAEEGRLALSDPIARWLPELADLAVLADPQGPLDAVQPLARPITVEDLLTHRSGLAAFYTARGPIAQAYVAAFRTALADPLTEERWLAALAALPLLWQPGTRFHYGLSTDVLGLLVARVAGRGLGEVLRERITGPLGMADTGFFVPEADQPRVARMYRETGPRGELADLTLPVPLAPPLFESGSGGLFSTMADYLVFARMMLGGGALDGVRIARPETVALMAANRLTEAQRALPAFGLADYWRGTGFGLGLATVLDPAAAQPGAGGLGSFGWSGAFGTWWTADPGRDLVALYMSQDFLALDSESITHIFNPGRPARAPEFAFKAGIDRLR